MTLSRKLLLLLLVFAIAPVLVLGGVAYNRSRACIEKRMINHLVSTNLLKKAEINRWIGDNTRVLETLAAGLRLTRDMAGDLAAHQVGDPGYEITHAAIRRQYLLPVVEGSGFFEVFLVHGTDGVALVSSNPNTEGRIYDQTPYFQRGREGTFVQTVYYSMSLQQPAMTISTPVKDAGGKLLCVLVGRLDLDALSRIVTQRSGLSPTEDTYIVNKFNFFLTEPRFGEGFALKKTVRTEAVQAALSGRGGVGYYDDYRGVPVLGAYEWVSRWEIALLTEIEEQEAFDPIYDLRRIIFGLCGVVALLALGFGQYGARRISRPLQRLVKGTERVGRGDFDFKAQDAGPDEIGELARAFERMARQLNETLVSRDALEKEVAERIAVEEQLNETLIDLERSNRELEQFAYVASHDLQEPLRMVASYTRLLAQRYGDRLDERGHRYIGYAVDGALRMQQFIQDLLAYSRVATRGADFETVDSHAALGRALVNLQTAVTEAGALVTADDLPAVFADSAQLVQVFQNLVGNAVKFRGSDPPLVQVSARAEGDEWVFAVKDNGIGIDPKYADRIFVIFQRLHTIAEYPGTGIGLALCKRIVERHGGRIWFESEPGAGTTFCFTLPRRESR